MIVLTVVTATGPQRAGLRPRMVDWRGDGRPTCTLVVYEHDQFSRQFAPTRNILHVQADGARGEPIGALVEYVDGTIDFEYMAAKQIGRRRKHSRAADPNHNKRYPRKFPTAIATKCLAALINTWQVVDGN